MELVEIFENLYNKTYKIHQNLRPMSVCNLKMATFVQVIHGPLTKRWLSVYVLLVH